MGKLTLLIGGARSGKSTLAEKLAAQLSDRVLYVATAIPFDDEMELRIKKHKKQRPHSWKTMEIPTGIGKALQSEVQSFDVILLDCITLLVNNLFMECSVDPDDPDESKISQAIVHEMDEIEALIKSSAVNWILVSNEVGLGLVPPYPLGRLYRDFLGWANQRLVSLADEVYLMIAGKAVPLHDIALNL
jgi:adenosylcobinamide kinase/adenosylcobinamide-phosphate guanylyltransferase